MEKVYKLASNDRNTVLNVVAWEPEGEVTAVVQIAHGITEHIYRYQEFARNMNAMGIYVIGNDCIGHGKSVAFNSEPMYFGNWNHPVDDLLSVYEMAKEQHPDVPYILMGFSMGSFMARQFAIDHSEKIDGLILIGTGHQSAFKIALGKLMANIEVKKVGETHGSSGIDRLTFDTYNKDFEEIRTDFDWLCAYEPAVDEFMNDPLRGQHISSGMFRELLKGMRIVTRQENIMLMEKSLPVLFLSGEDDPVGEFGLGVEKAYKAFKRAKMKDVEKIIYPDLRHDILHEEEHTFVFKDIYKWISSFQ